MIALVILDNAQNIERNPELFEKPTPLDTLNALVKVANEQTVVIETLGEELIRQQNLLSDLVDQHRRVIHEMKIAKNRIERLERQSRET